MVLLQPVGECLCSKYSLGEGWDIKVSNLVSNGWEKEVFPTVLCNFSESLRLISLSDVCVLVTQSLSMDCSLPGSSVHGILQARILEWVAISFLQGIFLTQGLNPGLLHCRQILYHQRTFLKYKHHSIFFKTERAIILTYPLLL